MIKSSKEIRQQFLDFFASKNHIIVPSAPLVVKNDPTLMFVNSGMAPFKALFLGEQKIVHPRIADTQKCLRVSGKHNDLEDVGLDTYHHTLFEMLGNWSFGDYFKKEAIEWAWELLTEVYKIPTDQIYVTIFEGDANENLDKDTEAYNIWANLIEPTRIINGNKKDNFWEMGDTGPCGPCSEIHIDLRPSLERAKTEGRLLVNADHPQVVEVWNLVFMQYERKANGSLVALPNKHVDTGMGFERLCMTLQQKQSNYDTDVFQPLIQSLAKKCGIQYGSNEKTDIAMRVISDHIRAISFTIADGQLPSNNKAGYVIRRILRRAIRYGYSSLNFKDPFLFELVDILSDQMGDFFPEIKNQKDFIKKVIHEEEISFLRTLSAGILRFEKYVEGKSKIDGAFAFELYDTFGFPVDLTQLIAKDFKLEVDMHQFTLELEKQKERSRKATTMDTDDWVIVNPEEGTEFIGYDQYSCDASIKKYRKVKEKNTEYFQVVLDKTPFYAESGGQVGDTGYLDDIKVFNTKKENNALIHFVNELPEDINTKVFARIDENRRSEIACNHSATHLLHAALKNIVGEHVNQKGSLVNDEYLRFDFSHFSKLSDEELERIEDLVNEKIRANIDLKEERNMDYQKAIDSGVTALFGEKYGDKVRVITFEEGFSKELCGGSHVSNTGKIGYFKIISEAAVAAGVRRIEAISGKRSEAYIKEQIKSIKEIKQKLKNEDPIKGIQVLQEENAKLQKENDALLVEKAGIIKQELLGKAKEIDGIELIAELIQLPSAEAVKSLIFGFKSIKKKIIVVLGTEIDGKPNLSVLISDELMGEKKYNAVQIIKEIAKEIQGGGGGQDFYANAGGKKVEGLKAAIDKVYGLIKG